jgi:hypothetical protein
MPQGVADGLGEVRGGGDSAQVGLQPGVQGLDDRSTAVLPRLSPVFGWMAADLALDRVERLDPRQHLGRERRLGGDVELVEVPPHVDHPNTITGLRFRLVVPLVSQVALPRRRRAAAAG